jgi:hypothetical protein
VFEVEPNTVLQWFVDAGEQRKAFSRYVLCDVHVRPLPLDELYAVLRTSIMASATLSAFLLGSSI